MDMEQMKSKIAPVVDEVIRRANCEGPVSEAVVNDAELGLFMILAMEFVSRTPTAYFPLSDIVDKIDGYQVMMEMPIPQMWDAFYGMRIKQMDGESNTSSTSKSDSHSVTAVPGALPRGH